MIHLAVQASWRIGMIVGVSCMLVACDKAPEQARTPAAPAPAAAAEDSCAPSGALNYICGLKNAEDIVRLPDSEWLIVSGMSVQGAKQAPGRVYIVNHMTKTHEEWFPGPAPSMKPDTKMFADCPGPVNTASFSPHGLAIQQQSEGKYRLYMTSHGEREAIEVFDVETAGVRPTLAWVGCVMLPEKTFANSVAILADGGFVTTKMMDPTVPNPFAIVMSGGISGNVYEWHPGEKVTAVPGTELSGANGIELSPDQRWMFVAAIGSSEIVRFDRNSKPLEKNAVTIDIRPDNLRWTANGKLYTVGGDAIAPANCASPPCPTGWSVYEIDPESLQATRVTGVDETAKLKGASTALAVGDEIWIGTYSGDRLGYLPKP